MLRLKKPDYKVVNSPVIYTFSKSKDFKLYMLYFVNYPNTEDEFEDGSEIEFWCKDGFNPIEWLKYVIRVFESNGFDWTSEFELNDNTLNLISEFTKKDLSKHTFNLIDAYSEIEHYSYCFRKLTEMYSQMYHTMYGDNGESALDLIKDY